MHSKNRRPVLALRLAFLLAPALGLGAQSLAGGNLARAASPAASAQATPVAPIVPAGCWLFRTQVAFGGGSMAVGDSVTGGALRGAWNGVSLSFGRTLRFDIAPYVGVGLYAAGDSPVAMSPTPGAADPGRGASKGVVTAFAGAVQYFTPRLFYWDASIGMNGVLCEGCDNDEGGAPYVALALGKDWRLGDRWALGMFARLALSRAADALRSDGQRGDRYFSAVGAGVAITRR